MGDLQPDNRLFYKRQTVNGRNSRAVTPNSHIGRLKMLYNSFSKTFHKVNCGATNYIQMQLLRYAILIALQVHINSMAFVALQHKFTTILR